MGDVFAQGQVAEGAMRVDRVVVVDPDGQLVDHGSDVGRFGEADVVAIHGAHERLGHAVRLRSFDGHRARAEVDLACEAASSPGGVGATVIRESFDGRRQPVHTAKAMLDGGGH